MNNYIKYLNHLLFALICATLTACTQVQITPGEKTVANNEACKQEVIESSDLQFSCDDLIINVKVNAEQSSTPDVFNKEDGQWILALSLEPHTADKQPLFDFSNAQLTRNETKITDLEVDKSDDRAIQLKGSVMGTAPVFVSGIKVNLGQKTYELNTMEIKLNYNELTLGKLVIEVLAHSVIILGG
ncbi:hypothetical protein [Marinomonas balearica]|uniref:Lipoprotein n=1 Tax=Marinomonas balearica TaxID=491947 RepID=A0A4R6M6Q1_9GAMM|nr:hypothetical protein [Marinomonas balearica]TDO95729.1 hypothetical protein DFP79_3083 [Marinomonas balearica]